MTAPFLPMLIIVFDGILLTNIDDAVNLIDKYLLTRARMFATSQALVFVF
jgi:hypothetical protein